jgi:hypothetical protein
MADENKQTDWSIVNNAIQKRQSETSLPLNPNRPLEVPNQLRDNRGVASPEGGVVKPDGVIANFQLQKVSRKAAVEHLKTWYAAQLDVARHHLAEVARVRKAESTVLADQFLRGLNAQNLAYLTQLGLTNERTRVEGVMALNDHTSKALKEIETRDWPPALRGRAMGAILERNEKFMGQLMNELGD